MSAPQGHGMEALPDSGGREFQIEVGVQIWRSPMGSLELNSHNGMLNNS